MLARQGGARLSLGLISGTSMDGVDLALLHTDGDRAVTPGPTGFVAYRDEDRALLRDAVAVAVTLTDRDARPGVLAEAERRVTERHAEAVEGFLRQHGMAARGVDVIGFHGQTVLHRPERALTVQIGDAGALARQVGIDVVADFRAADMVAGGQGAPLVPAYHRALAQMAGRAGPLALLNIGGVANITFLPQEGDPIACDTGPGNALIDDLMLERTGLPLDRDGATAARGQVHDGALLRLLDHPFFDLPAPKSLDRNDFSRDPVAGLATADAAATLVAFTAASIGRVLPRLPERPREIIVCGGGARNPTLMAELRRRLPVPVSAAEDHGWNADAIEAQAFAYFAVRSLAGLPLTFPTTTGVSAPTSGGVFYSAR